VAESRREFFDRIASQWDERVDLAQMARTLREGLTLLAVAPDAIVIDLGCGTGNLTRALLDHLGADGRVVAVDFSASMLCEAQRKVSDPRVQWTAADAAELPLADAKADRIICFSAWPHFPEPRRALAEARRVLRPGGELCIWHAKSRAAINEIHAHAGGAVEHDRLPPAQHLARLAEAAGLEPFEVVDDDRRYFIRARAPRAGG
jgi:ubiquinone/menaquinone biosynthesis C-methylase UbiE